MLPSKVGKVQPGYNIQDPVLPNQDFMGIYKPYLGRDDENQMCSQCVLNSSNVSEPSIR